MKARKYATYEDFVANAEAGSDGRFVSFPFNTPPAGHVLKWHYTKTDTAPSRDELEGGDLIPVAVRRYRASWEVEWCQAIPRKKRKA